jgi:hypothetical protein
LHKATGQEKNGRELDYDCFEQVSAPEPSARHAVYHAVDFDFRLRQKGLAIDAGQVIPTINGDFEGRAPDLGAIEFNQPLPIYGPRWLKHQPFYR